MPAKVRRFRAKLERSEGGLGWTVARVPFDAKEAWPQMVRRRVAGKVNGVPFRNSLFSDGRAGWVLLVNRELQRAAGVQTGDCAEFELRPDLEDRPSELPDELAALLDEEPGLRAWYDGLTEYMRRELGKWVTAPKSEDARLRRARQLAERLLASKEAESELPPQLEAAFRARPQAKKGWELMTVNQRRNELLAVFYYQTPETRARRIDKLLDKLCDLAEKQVG